MAAKKKKSKIVPVARARKAKPVKAPRKKKGALAVEAEVVPSDVPTLQQPPRINVLVCGKSFWVDNQLAFNAMALEAATRGMRRGEFVDFIERYRLSLTLWAAVEGPASVQLCESGRLSGDWL